MRRRSEPEGLGPAEDVAPAVVDEVIKAYYPAVLKSADAARQRAQNAYAIASAIAAALVAAGIFTQIGDAEAATQVVAFLSLIGWLAAAALFMYAVAGRVNPKIGGEQPNGSAFVRAATTNARDERETINDRLDLAQIVTIIAIVLTVIAIALVLFNEPQPSTKHARVGLTAAGSVAVASVCGVRLRFIDGELDPDDLGDDYVPVEIESGRCGEAETLRLRQKDIASVALDE